MNRIGFKHSKESKEKMSKNHTKYWLGKKRSKETIERMCTFKLGYTPWNKGKKGLYKTPNDVRQKQRKSRINYIEEKKFVEGKFLPRIGKYETSILDVLEKCFNYKILRQYFIAGYFLDGYCPALNLAIEIDEKNGHGNSEQLKKDQYREEQVKNDINCQFLRIPLGGKI